MTCLEEDVIQEHAEFLDELDLTYAQFLEPSCGCYICVNFFTGRIIGKRCGGKPFDNIRIISKEELPHG